MMRTRWSRLLYKRQPYPNNYMAEPQKRTFQKTHSTLYEINRLSQNISAVFIHFSVYYHVRGGKVSDLPFLILAAAAVFVAAVSRRDNIVRTTAQSAIVLSVAFLMTNILRTLVVGLEDSTVYLCSGILNIFFVLDATRCAVMNAKEPKFDAGNRPLKIEHVDILKIKDSTIPIFGYNAALLATILLISRLAGEMEAFFLLCFTFFWYFVIEHCVSSRNSPREFVFSAAIIAITSTIYTKLRRDLLCLFLTVQITLYLAGAAAVHALNCGKVLESYMHPR